MFREDGVIFCHYMVIIQYTPQVRIQKFLKAGRGGVENERMEEVRTHFKGNANVDTSSQSV